MRQQGITPQTKFVEPSGLLTKDGFNSIKTLEKAVGLGALIDEAAARIEPDLAALRKAQERLQSYVGDNARAAIASIKQVAELSAAQDTGNWFDKQELRTELRSQYGQITAEYTEVITAATGPGSALVQRVENLEATIPDLATAAALDALTVRVTDTEDGIEAVADAITVVETAVGDVNASGIFRVTSEAASSGAVSRAALSVSATAGGVTEQAAIYLEALTGGGSRALFVADQIAFVDNLGNKFALFEAGTSTINNLHVSNLTFDNIALEGISKTRFQELSAPATITNTYSMMARVLIEGWEMTDNVISGMARIVAPFNTNGITEGFYYFEVRRADNIGMTGAKVIASDVINPITSGIYTSVQIPFSDRPPGAGDWYYAIYAKWYGAANQTTTLRLIHATLQKR